MLLTLIAVGLAVAVLARRIPWVRERMPPPASTLLTAAAASAVGLMLAELGGGLGRALLAGASAAFTSVLLIVAAGTIRARLADPLERWQATREGKPTLRERLTDLADASPLRIRGWNVASVALRSILRAGDVRVTGLAAEMTYYGLISLVPIATALGSSLGFLRPLLGEEEVVQIRESIVDGLTTIFAQQVASDVLAPLVDGLLSERRTGFAIGALLVTLYLASRMFSAAVRALNDAYRVRNRRPFIVQYLLGALFTIGAIVTLVTIVVLLVIGPLVGGGSGIAEALGFGEAFRTAWDTLRWPVAFAVVLAFLVLLYRYAPNVETTWQRCVPGAVVGAIGTLIVSGVFVTYVSVVAPTAGTAADADAVVQAAGQMLSLVLAGVLWLWLGSIVVLLGGILNAEIDAERNERAEHAAERDAWGE